MKYSITAIAKEPHRDKSTISRELKRNRDSDGYYPNRAEEKYKSRRKKCRRKRKLDDPRIYEYVKEKFLGNQWSPEEIEGCLKYEGSDISISCVTIYRGIYARMFDDPHLSRGSRGAIRKLRHHGKMNLMNQSLLTEVRNLRIIKLSQKPWIKCNSIFQNRIIHGREGQMKTQTAYFVNTFQKDRILQIRLRIIFRKSSTNETRDLANAWATKHHMRFITT